MSQHFDPTFESLRTYSAPEWFRDAKFGIWSHCGPQSVPMFGDWYARNMYVEGTPQYEYHVRHYGHPSKFGYKDVCALWKAENFDPESLADRYYKAGARYLMTQGTHHDHFFNYGSEINRMNSVNVGPHKDILALWKKAADRLGMPFGISEHLGASFSWWRVNKGCDKQGPYAGVPYDGNDPAYQDFYHANQEHGTDNPGDISPWYTPNPEFQAYWQRCIYEMIDRFHPDLLYTDGVLPFGGHWMGEKLEDVSNVEQGYEDILKAFPLEEGYKVAIVHGQQSNEQKDFNMRAFAEGRAHILVSTTVIEVGVDVPNASVMVIRSAQRFGLSQLHQLRGRVGRGAEKSYCILVKDPKTSREAQQRLELMCSTEDGFEIAEQDMKMRGPGDLEGTQQSGLPIALTIASLTRDGLLLEEARHCAQGVLDADPSLERPENAVLVRELRKGKYELQDYSNIS